MSTDLSPANHAPVVLFVYRRHAQLRRTLACLERSGVRHLHVFSDGPADASAEDDVRAVRSVVASVDWVDPVVVEHEKNLGLSRSIRFGLDLVFEDHETVIVVEDDVFVAPGFCAYASLGLAEYRDSPSVAGVTGLRYPFNRRAFDGYAFDVFMSPRFSSWGWATWRDRWNDFTFDLPALRSRIESAPGLHAERAGADMVQMVNEAVVTGTLKGSWDVVCATNMLLRNQYFVTPTWNMIENGGLSDGTHYSRAPRWQLRFESEHQPALDRLRFAPVGENERVLKEYRKFFKPSLLARVGARSRALR